ncbi:MAG: catalytic domain [Moorella sp. (in: firmicutes)]|nr:catalytic domain [Moorella sp. (in: firmicutes)]
MKWDSSDEKDKRIVEFGRWYGLNEVDDKAPERAGAYVFINDSYDVKYVGKAGARRLRNEIKDAIKRGKDREATKFGWFATNSDEAARSLESDWIKKYDPPNNVNN